MIDGLTVEVKILDARILAWGVPKHHSAMAAGIDLFACCDERIVLEPQSPAVLIPSGIAIHINDPTVTAIIAPRSGLGHRHGLVLGNTIGIVDADYTGPVLVSAWNRSAPGTEPIVIAPGDRIAQLLFVPILHPTLTIVDAFTATTERGASGFGSTGGRSVT
jgi:dUTP pyrophosphatase